VLAKGNRFRGRAIADAGRIERDMLVTWLKRRFARPTREPEQIPEPPKTQRSAVQGQYRPLHKYLDDRFADTVVLTFSQIEDILGFALPDPARVEQEWWADADADGAPSAQARAWTKAHRTAKANLSAQTTVFERG
jgi:hypothetical protein